MVDGRFGGFVVRGDAAIALGITNVIGIATAGAGACLARRSDGKYRFARTQIGANEHDRDQQV